MAVFRRY